MECCAGLTKFLMRVNVTKLWEKLAMNSQEVRLAFAWIVVAAMAGGCGGGSNSLEGTGSQDAQITGQYNLVLSSSKQEATTNIYTNLVQSGTTLAGMSLVCPSNDATQCKGDDPSVSITSHGTVDGQGVTITISFFTTAGEDTVTMKGSAVKTGSSGLYRLSGTYADQLGDAGTWIGSGAVYRFVPLSGQYSYTGTLNSTANPLMIAPTISLAMGADASSNLTGEASITNSPCVSSLTLSGHAMGDAFVVTDAQNKIDFTVLPVDPGTATGISFAFSYKFDPSAPSCAADFGRGTLTMNGSPWDY